MPDRDRLLNHVLVVDDDPILRTIVESYFKRRGARRITAAANGIEALAAVDAAQGKLSFVLCDLNMPELDGIAFLRHLQHRNFAAPIAILSGEDQSVIALAETLAQKHRLNIVGALKKPANVMDLDRLVLSAGSQANDLRTQSPGGVGSGELKAAIVGGQIKTHYQPQINVRSGKLAGVEVLARWAHPRRGMIEPAVFVPMAEGAGLIDQLTDVVIRGAIDDDIPLRKLRSGPKLAFNFSAAVLQNIKFPDQLAAIADARKIERSRIVCEISQSKLLEEDAIPLEVMARLRILGFELSIDDFGKDYSNIDALKMFPFSELKFDLPFIAQAPSEDHAKAIIRSCTSLANRFGLRIVAERVETLDDLDLVTGQGVDVIQGDLLAKAMDSDALTAWILEYSNPIKRPRPRFAQSQPMARNRATGPAVSTRNPTR